MATTIYPEYATIFAAVCASIFTVIGILGNLITILALLRCPKLRSHATTAFVLSLCISDLLFCSMSLPLQAIRYTWQKWTLGETLCHVFPVILYGNVAVSLLSMVGITMNRYILIAYNSVYASIYRSVYIWIQLFLVWVVAFSLLIPPLLGVWGQMGLDELTFSCTILPDDAGRSPKKVLFLVGFLIPCIVIIISYTCIYCTVRRQRMRMRSHSGLQGIPKGSNSSREREDSRLTTMMLTIFCCYLLCFLPLMLVNVFDNDVEYPVAHVLASVMCWASGVINPFIYAASNRNYRVAYTKLFRRLIFWNNYVSPVPSKSMAPSRISKDPSVQIQKDAAQEDANCEIDIEANKNKDTIIQL
ncbi:protein trapped in endoderm-1 [Lutzomyia longipalpis]|uniref:protein trapped in endoderm-1 n=1 Tax=Lutzomyia longipalpis TaxID=7200 RepID=UPI0024837AC1|nr:protein trapped in endoderm-1 [Lutzomyia longipalpis]